MPRGAKKKQNEDWVAISQDTLTVFVIKGLSDSVIVS